MIKKQFLRGGQRAAPLAWGHLAGAVVRDGAGGLAGCSQHPAAWFWGLNEGDVHPELLLHPAVAPPEPSLTLTENAAVRKKKTFNTFIERYKSRSAGCLFFPPKNQEKPLQKMV